MARRISLNRQIVVKIFLVACIFGTVSIFISLNFVLTTVENGQEDRAKIMMEENHGHKIAGLSCAKYGGPNDDIAQEMVYWSDIPSDAKFVSPFKNADDQESKYLTFEPDIAGFNNMRMSLETVAALAHAMGRTLVLPPNQEMNLARTQQNRRKKKSHFSFADFFHFYSLNAEQSGYDVITMEEFLSRMAMTGKLVDKTTHYVSFPPQKRIKWDGQNRQERQWLYTWLRTVAQVPIWKPGACIAAFPDPSDVHNVTALEHMKMKIIGEGRIRVRKNRYLGNPVPVDAPPIDRMREMIDDRKELCLYDEELQKAPVVHLECNMQRGTRLLVHFYAFLFFQDWKQDLWTKRFIGDHLRYSDELQCAAARVVSALRERARLNKRNPNPPGAFDSFHIRRGDFHIQYKHTQVEADVIYENSKDQLTEGATVYIATDERDLNFFRPLAEHYDICFLNDFQDLIAGVDASYYGMLDQLIASRGRVFFGVHLSTFTGYINRMRGYHAVKNKLKGHEKGITESYNYIPLPQKYNMREYRPVSKPFWAREFPSAWRDIDRGYR